MLPFTKVVEYEILMLTFSFQNVNRTNDILQNNLIKHFIEMLAVTKVTEYEIFMLTFSF